MVFSHYRLSSVPVLVGEAPFFHGEHHSGGDERAGARDLRASRAERGRTKAMNVCEPATLS